MIMECVWWELTEKDPDIARLRTQLAHTDITVWHPIGALQAKYWIMNESPPRWGAVILWRGEKPALSVLPPNLAAEAIGRSPDVRLHFTVAASCLNESISAPWASLFQEETCTTTSS
ncbi:hypothetical protein BIY29_03390 [Brenneria alni]|uniref:Uncharacterized protein n=1 Tax=Brenneria alni TaxID=71656 RepID=A0A421DSF3_9GAMM|nr:hypothetical protein [Brenneria alni]RLM27275.1 hypothetical protein BIY29_03390 [Brenneria alni]